MESMAKCRTTLPLIVTIIYMALLYPTEGCGGSYRGDTGSVTSPNYPNNYANGLNCYYTISLASSGSILLDFEDFNVENHGSCVYDYLEVRDGSSSSSPLLGKLCGTSRPSRISGTGSTLYLRFRTDGSVTPKGWKANWSSGNVVNGGWTGYSSWGRCTRTCGRGYQIRSRSCTNPTPSNGGSGCSGSPRQTRDCNTHNCPRDGNWGSWTPYSDCSATCEQGLKSRTRTCNSPSPAYNGRKCASPGGVVSHSGHESETIICVRRRCPIHGAWSAWGAWPQCDAQECQTQGHKIRRRSCDNPSAQYGGKTCPGSPSDTAACTNPQQCNDLARCRTAAITPTGRYLIDPLDNTKFYQCSRDGTTITHKPCGGGTQWTAKSQQTANGGQTPSCEGLTPATTTQTCKAGPQTFKAAADETKYIWVVGGAEFPMGCPPGTVFKFDQCGCRRKLL